MRLISRSCFIILHRFLSQCHHYLLSPRFCIIFTYDIFSFRFDVFILLQAMIPENLFCPNLQASKNLWVRERLRDVAAMLQLLIITTRSNLLQRIIIMLRNCCAGQNIRTNLKKKRKRFCNLNMWRSSFVLQMIHSKKKFKIFSLF